MCALEQNDKNIDPYFSKERLTGERFLECLKNDLIPALVNVFSNGQQF